MVDINEAFPSKYLKAADLKGTNQRVIIGKAEQEKIGDDYKLVLYFKDKEKGMVLNKTNAKAIADEYGTDTDDWEGSEVILFPAMVDFQGKTVEAIRVRRPAAKDRTAQAARPENTKSASVQATDMDDEIPF